MGFFLGIAFLAMMASCLMFKILSGATRDKDRYTPKSEQDYRAHADNIDPEQFLNFVQSLADYNVDIILECKNKDDALLTLRRHLVKAGYAGETVAYT